MNNQRYFVNNKRGQAMIMATLFFVASVLIILGGIAHPLLQDRQNVRQIINSKQSYFFSEGAIEDVVYRLKGGIAVSSSEILVNGTYSATTTTTDVVDTKEVEARGDVANAIRKVKTTVVAGEGVSFTFGLQSGNGGILLKNSSSVVGSAFSNGSIVGENTNSVSGEGISAGPSGLISGLNVGGSAYANNIQNSTIGADAYYQTISGSTVGGTEYPGSSEQDPASLPIEDSLVEDWKTQAVTGGTITTCPYVTNTDVTIGPVKIECDWEAKGNATITLTGMVWVEGNIEVENNVTVRADASIGDKAVAVIADDPTNQSTKGTIIFKNSASFVGNGQPKSFILFLSQNNSAEMSGGNTAISVENGATGDLLVYAGHGKIVIKNNVALKEVTAYRIEAENNSEVVYESGIANLLFTSGPTGGFSIDDWTEVE